MLTAGCGAPPNASPTSRSSWWVIASQELQYRFYLKASDPARRSRVVKFQICALYTVLRRVSAVINISSPVWWAVALYTDMTEALQRSSSLCSYSSLISSPDTAFLWLRKGTSDHSRNRGKAHTLPGSRDSPTPTIARPTPKKITHIMSLLPCLGAHLHCPREDLTIPIFPDPWFCFVRKLKKNIHKLLLSKPTFTGLKGQQKPCLRNKRLIKALRNRLSSVATAGQYRALSSKYWRT